jgi:CBS domain containing-hemolysin-like protein
MDYYLRIVAIIILLLFSAFFSSSETAFFSLNRVRLRRRKIQKKSGFKNVMDLLKTPSTFLTTVLIGNEIVNISISVAVATLVYSLVQDMTDQRFLPFCSMAVTVPVLLLFGEILPKTVAVKFPEKIALFNAYPLRVFSIAITPLRHILNSAAKVFIRLFVRNLKKQPLDTVNIDESIFRSMIDIGSKEGTIEPHERDLIHRTFHLDDILISQIMISKDSIVAVPLDVEEQSLMQLIQTKRFSRYPVYEGTIDQIVGFVHAKDLLRLRISAKSEEQLIITPLLRKPTFVLENRNVLSVLLQFQRNKTHIGIVVDVQGKTTGLVTLEDILEELVGEIKDETDMEDESDA